MGSGGYPKMNKIEICLEIKKETKMAFLVSDGDEEVWLPKSQIELDQDGGEGDTVIINMPEWLAMDKRFI